MTIKLIEAIAQKAADRDGLTAADKQEIAAQYDRTPADRAKVDEVLTIFDDLVVDTGERQRLIELLNLDASAQKQLTGIVGNDGKGLVRRYQVQADGNGIPLVLFRDTTQSATVRVRAAQTLGISKHPHAREVLS